MTDDKLDKMLELQRQLQIKAYGKDPSTIDDPLVVIEFIKDMHIALTDELHEALGEVGWKPWATRRHINTDAFKSELVDAWHFFMNLMLVVGMDADELFDRYVEKREKNQKRQDEGYDGVKGKCPLCKRALDDTFVFCKPDEGFCEMALEVGVTH